MAENTDEYARSSGASLDVRQPCSPHGVGPSSPAGSKQAKIGSGASLQPDSAHVSPVVPWEFFLSW